MSEDPVRARGRSYEREPFAPAPPLPRPVDDRRRWRRTDVSFGLAGRLACSAVVLIPPWRLLATGSVFWLLVTFAAVIPSVFWLRATWQRN